MMFADQDEDILPQKQKAPPSLYELLDNVIYFEPNSELLPLAQYVRSRALPGHPSPPNVEPYLLPLLKVQPGNVQAALLAMLKAYMDEHPEKFMKYEVA